MISWLIDGALLSALVYTSWRTTTMVREIRRLRSEESVFRKTLQDTDTSINKAAHAVVMLRGEGVETLRLLEARIVEARALAEELEQEIRSADMTLNLAAANDLRPVQQLGPVAVAAAATAAPVAPAVSPQDTWLSLIESRLATVSAGNR